MRNKARMRSGVLMLFLLLTNLPFVQQATAQNSRDYMNENGIALSGYDVVSYHQSHEAQRGSKAHASEYKGSTFYFVDATNKSAFDEQPDAYLPAFGGYCAFAMAVGNGKVPSDPKTFKIHNGTLYWFFNDYYEGAPFNTIVPWNADELNHLGNAQANWRALE